MPRAKPQPVIAEPQWTGLNKTGRPTWYKAGHLAYLGSKAASERLGTNRRTFYRWVRAHPKALPGYRIRSSTFYLSTDLDAFWQRYHSPTPDPRGRKLISTPKKRDRNGDTPE